MRKYFVLAFTIALGLGACRPVRAQAGAPEAAAIGKPMAPSQALDAMLTQLEGEVMGVVKAMPAAKFDFAPSQALFIPSQETQFTGVRSFAAQAKHLAQANYYFYSLVGGLKPDVDVKKIGLMTSKDEIVASLQASFVFAHKGIATVTAANAFNTIKGADGMNTPASLAAFGVAHGFDHYGQMVEYLRMNAIVPPASAK